MSRSTTVRYPAPRREPVTGEAEAGSAAEFAQLTDGLGQSLTLFGRTFHVQTEIQDGRLRTEVFLDGRVIATREAQLDDAERQEGNEAQRSRMNAFHQNVVSEVRKRAKSRGQDRQEPTPIFVSNENIRALPSPPSGSSPSRTAGLQRENPMAQVSLEPLATIDGFIGACLVDSESGMMLGAHGGGAAFNLEIAAAGNTQVVRAKNKTMDSLKLKDRIEDILISLLKQYHLIRPLEHTPAIFIYLVLDRSRANLAMARHELKAFESRLNLR